MDDADTGRGRPRARDLDEAILTATAELLVEHGYAALTIEGVAARAGVGKPTVYRRWGSKAALAMDALTRMVSGVPMDDRGGLREDVSGVVHQLAERLAKPLARAVLLDLTAAAGRDPVVAERLHDIQRDEHAVLAAGTARAVERGELPAGADADLLQDVVSGTLMHRILVHGETPDADYLERLVTFVLRGLGAP